MGGKRHAVLHAQVAVLKVKEIQGWRLVRVGGLVGQRVRDRVGGRGREGVRAARGILLEVMWSGLCTGEDLGGLWCCCGERVRGEDS